MGFAATTLRMGAGIGIWALNFAALYGATTLACARGDAAAVVPAAVVATLAAAAALMSIAWRGWARRARFDCWMSAMIAGLALLTVTWEALPVLLLPPCE